MLTMPPVVKSDLEYKALLRGMNGAQQNALTHLVATGSIGPTDSRSIEALEKRDLIVERSGGYQATELGILLALYIETYHKPIEAGRTWQGVSNT